MWKPLALLVLAGCATDMAPSGARSGAPAVVAQSRAGVALPAAMGETRLLVRAVPAGTAAEGLADAACEAVSPYSTARFRAPALLLLPDFGSASPAVTVRCTAGELTGAATSVPQARLPSGGGFGGWPAVGVSVGTGSSGGVGVGLGWSGGGYGGSAGRAVVGYPPLDIVLAARGT